jgi:hypothetical protein
LGIEKPRKNSASPYETAKANINTSRLTGLLSQSVSDEIHSILKDFRFMVLTHILSVDQSNSKSKECFIYNVYQNEKADSWCQHKHIAKINKDNTTWLNEGWKALVQFGLEIKDAVQREKATHIIILATGWNTEQYESYRDFDFWMKILVDDFKNKEKDFRPIFVGISWEPELRKIYKVPGFKIKAHDADEIGFTWGNYLLNDILKPVAASSNSKPQIVAIGHSLGSRIIFGSHYVRDVIDRESTSLSNSYPITLIGLQPAFSIDRFVPDGGKEYLYNQAYKSNATVVMTSSRYDKATGIIPKYVGGKKGLDEFRKHTQTYNGIINEAHLNNMDLPNIQEFSQDKVNLYDVSSFVNCTLPGKNSFLSGAHDDIYDAEMGKFLGEIIRLSNRKISK